MTLQECATNAESTSPFGLALHHYFYCQSQKIKVNHVRCNQSGGDCDTVGQSFFRATTFGRGYEDGSRKIALNMVLSDWKHVGEVRLTDSMTLNFGCLSIMPIGLPCDMAPGTINGATMPIAEWQTAGVTSATFILAKGPGVGGDKVIKYDFNSHLSVPTAIPPDLGFSRNGFRCDEGGNYVGKFTGCVFDRTTEIFFMDRNDPASLNAADHIWTAQNEPQNTYPKILGKKIPGSISSQVPLTRVRNPLAQENRNSSVASCVTHWGPSYTNGGYQCDEYPFASTRQGTRNNRDAYSIRPIPGPDNRKGGDFLKAFYHQHRILENDNFYVEMTGSGPAPRPVVNPPSNVRCRTFPVPRTPLSADTKDSFDPGDDDDGEGPDENYGKGEFGTCGSLLDKYLQLGGPEVLGYPVTNNEITADGQGAYTHFQKLDHAAPDNSIYYTSGSGAHQIGGAIRDKWATLGWEGGIGYPATDELATPDAAGRFNHFRSLGDSSEDNSIYYSPAGGAHQVGGAIRGKWASMGWEKGLGYPSTDESGTPDGIGRYNHFRFLGDADERNSIYYSADTGAHQIGGDIRDAWKISGWETATGYPTTDETATPDGAGRYNHFRKPGVGYDDDSIYWHPMGAVGWIHGGIRAKWLEYGAERASGYPRGPEYPSSEDGGRVQITAIDDPSQGGLVPFLIFTYHPDAGIHWAFVAGPYGELNGPQSFLGYPTREPAYQMSPPHNDFSTEQIFTGGCIGIDHTTMKEEAVPWQARVCSDDYIPLTPATWNDVPPERRRALALRNARKRIDAAHRFDTLIPKGP
ncbi:NucA/NucB deoxyribonuclease domain-containing protein [Embleya sp. NPDC005575]|uniref:NucA/NucB deoxyribonuclease domain-containing protein n=1 Tax=Embleya sp. NPDC005575 TaxID=3156892 RepID=UPI0033BC8DC7